MITAGPIDFRLARSSLPRYPSLYREQLVGPAGQNDGRTVLIRG